MKRSIGVWLVGCVLVLGMTGGCGGHGGGDGDAGLQPCETELDCPAGYDCQPQDGGLFCVALPDAGPQDAATGTPLMVLDATQLEFGNPLLETPVEVMLTISNQGDGLLQVYDLVLLEDDDLQEFHLGAPAERPLEVAPGDSLQVSVILTAQDAEEDTGYLLVSSNDPLHAAVLLPLVSELKGTPALGVCVHPPPAPGSTCAEPPLFDYGLVSYGASAELLARLRNENLGNAPLTVEEVTVPKPPVVPTNLFDVELFTLEEDPGNPGTFNEVVASLPYLLGPQQSTPDLYLRLTFQADVDHLLADMVMVVDTDASDNASVELPIIWSISGCPPGTVDLEPGVPGCEYVCPVWPTTAEACNNTDDDCDGDLDEDFDLTSDSANCGYCGHLCSLANAQAHCANSLCAITSCLSGFENVNGDHSDGCEYTCPVTPPVPETCNQVDDDCDGDVDEDFNVQTDPVNCGTCGNDCTIQGLVCSGGSCVLTCPPGSDNCAGACVDIDTDPVNCGGCGNVPNPGDHVCTFPNAQAACLSQTCVMGPCDPAHQNLDGQDANGCEYTCPVWPSSAEVCDTLDNDCDGDVDEIFDLQNDPLHCGSCGNPCTFPNAQGICVSGGCQMGPCQSGYRDVDSNPATGCEYACPVNPPVAEVCDGVDNNCDGNADEIFDLQSDPAHCGNCTTSCSYPNAMPLCISGGCQMGSCTPGFSDVDGNPANGCEYTCPVWPPVAESCNGVDDNCNGTADESFDLNNDPAHCGNCTTVCSFPNAQALCVGGGCQLGVCDAGYRNNNGLDGDGCEYTCPVSPPVAEICDGVDNDCDGQFDESFDFQNDPLHCGDCVTDCSKPNALVECVAAACNEVGCLPSYYDLNLDLSNPVSDGCEYQCPTHPPALEVCDGVDNNCDGSIDEGFDTLNDPNHCGGCNNPCGASQLCCTGTCVPSDITNCGYCGRSCTGGDPCFNGTCVDDGVLVITEIFMNPALPLSDTAGEWFEVYNPTAYDINLNGWVLSDDGSDSHTINIDAWVGDGDYAVLARNGTFATNGGVVVLYQYSGIELANSADELVLTAGTVEVDRVDYTSAWVTEGRSTQLDPAQLAGDNSLLVNWCDTDNSAPYELPNSSVNYGTPAAAGHTCP